MNKFIILFFLFINIGLSQGAWSFSNRTHGELVWKTIKTENFNIHFHEEIYEIAVKGANIAEKIRPIIMKQVGLGSLPKLSIVFTSEDEIHRSNFIIGFVGKRFKSLIEANTAARSSERINLSVIRRNKKRIRLT